MSRKVGVGLDDLPLWSEKCFKAVKCEQYITQRYGEASAGSLVKIEVEQGDGAAYHVVPVADTLSQLLPLLARITLTILCLRVRDVRFYSENLFVLLICDSGEGF